MDTERQAIAAGAGIPAGWWMSHCSQPAFDPSQAVRLFMQDVQSKPDVVTALCIAQCAGSGQMSTGMSGKVNNFLGQIAQRQQTLGAASGGGAFARICGLMGLMP
jgi:hypothetical protein